ncbi:MAG: hypothetical protein H6606_03060 [Flavobacteriales bacterium]|nr:hypothetical protein [Flavobacteriales bacterium]
MENWNKVVDFLTERFGKKPDMNAVLFIIGMRELGEVRDEFSKEEKVRLMHIAICRLFSASGYYRLNGVDSKGWPAWEKVMDLPYTDVFEQESLLRQHIIDYFENEGILVFD